MSTERPWDEVDVLIPKRILEAYERGLEEVRQDVVALLDAIPVVECADPNPSEPENFTEADADVCKAWIVRIIRALPTTADMETIRDDF